MHFLWWVQKRVSSYIWSKGGTVAVSVRLWTAATDSSCPVCAEFFLQNLLGSGTKSCINLCRNNQHPRYCLPHSVCSTQPAWYLLCPLPMVLVLIICTARHVEIQSLSRWALMKRKHIRFTVGRRSGEILTVDCHCSLTVACLSTDIYSLFDMGVLSDWWDSGLGSELPLGPVALLVLLMHT